MNLTGQTVAQKPARVKPDPAYLDAVRALPCVLCGRHGVEAHHCRDLPDHGEQGLYDRLPGAARKSGDRDAIPLCRMHHAMFHLHRSTFHERAGGKDYQFIGPTRAKIANMELDY